MKTIILPFVCVLFVFLPAGAQSVFLVQDINKAKFQTSSSPVAITVWKECLYFSARDTINGTELWKYDAKAPAKMVFDNNPGTTSTVEGFGAIVVFQNKLYYPGLINGRHTLVVYDGINNPVEATGFSGFTTVTSLYLSQPAFSTGRLFFTTQKSVPGASHLYSYDGVNPPVAVKLPPPPNPNVGNGAAVLAELNGEYYLTAMASTYTKALLYKFIPGTDSVVLVTTSSYPNGFSNPNWGYVNGSRMYFTAKHDTAGKELFSYDGTTANMLTNVSPGVSSSVCSGPLYIFNNELFYTAGPNSGSTALYKCNPTTGGGTLAYSIGPNTTVQLQAIASFQNRLYLGAGTSGKGIEMLLYSPSGTTIVKDLYPGSFSGISTPYFTEFSGSLYFAGDDGVLGSELYRLGAPNTISKVNWEGSALVYPNPVAEQLQLELELPTAQSLFVSLIDLEGREVYRSNLLTYAAGKHRFPISVVGLVAGEYVYRISDGNGVVATGAVLKQ